MCRWLAYTGPPVLLTQVLYTPVHSLIEVKHLADRVGVMSHGHLVEESAPDALGGRDVSGTVISFRLSARLWGSEPPAGPWDQPAGPAGEFTMHTDEPSRVLGLPLTYRYGGVRTFGYIAGAGGLAVVLVYLAVNVAVIRAFRTEFRDEFSLWRHLLVPAAAAVLFLFPLWGIIHPRSRQLADLLHYTALGWLCLGIVVAAILRTRRPSSFETLGRVFMPADGQPAYAFEPAGDLAGGHSRRQGHDVRDGDGDA